MPKARSWVVGVPKKKLKRALAMLPRAARPPQDRDRKQPKLERTPVAR